MSADTTLLTLPFIAGLLHICLFLLASWQKRQSHTIVAESVVEADGHEVLAQRHETAFDLPSHLRRLRTTLKIHWPESALIGALILAGLWIWLSLPDPFALQSFNAATPGYPFYGWRYVDDLLLATTHTWKFIVVLLSSGISIVLGVVGWITYRRNDQRMAFARIGLLIVAFGLAVLGQLALQDDFDGSHLVLYGSASVVFLFWSISVRLDRLTYPVWSRTTEVLLCGLAFGFTAFARYYAIGAVPYGLEGDESKWSIEVISAMMYGQYPHSTEYHLSSVPLSFYMQAPFLHLFGPTITGGRIAIATYSVLGSMALYWFARQIAGARIAWLATMLLAVSLLDMSASRLANVESHVKLWPILALALLARAVRTKHLSSYALVGCMVALGLLTYETVAPIGGVVLLIMAVEWLRERPAPAIATRRLAAFLAPVVLVLPITLSYIYGRLSYYEFGEKAGSEGILSKLWPEFSDLGYALFVRTMSDFLYNRDGPLLNSVLLPWLVLGIVLSVVTWRQGRLYWALIYGFLFFVPVPVLAHLPAGRVFYPGLPAVYLLIAAALVAVYDQIWRVCSPSWRVLLKVGAGLALSFVLAQNMYTAFNKVFDFEDRKYRRELYDLSQTSAADDTLVLYPFVTAADDPIEQEQAQLIALGMRRRDGTFYSFQAVPIETLLPTIIQTTVYQKLTVVWDTVVQPKRDERDKVLSALLRCYPGALHQQGRAFDRYTLSREAISSASCSSGTLGLSPSVVETSVDSNLSLEWHLQTTRPVPELTLQCEAAPPGTTYIPAEAMSGPNWERLNMFVTGYEGDSFMGDTATTQPLTTTVMSAPDQPLYVWIRSLRRQADSFPGLLEVNGEIKSFSDSDTTALNEWVWQRVGPFTPTAQATIISITRPYNGSPDDFRALFLDTLIVTSDEAFDPTAGPFWEPLSLRTIPVADGVTSGSIPFDQPPGTYRCAVRVPESSQLIDPSGEGSLHSPPALIRVSP